MCFEFVSFWRNGFRLNDDSACRRLIFLSGSPCTGLDSPLGLQEVKTVRNSSYSTHERGKIVSLTHRPPLHPRRYSWYTFLSQAEP